MAEALDQAVETVEPESETSPPPPAEGEIVVPTPPATPVPAPAPPSNGIPEPERIPAPAGAEQHPPATLKNRYLIFPAMPLTNLDSPTATAYGVEDRREPGRKLFALVCTPGLPTRTQAMKELRNETVHGLLPLVDFGAVSWAPLNQSCMIVIFVAFDNIVQQGRPEQQLLVFKLPVDLPA